MTLLDGARVEERLRHEAFFPRVVVSSRCTSTNDEARRLASAGAPQGTVVLADEQTAGRGRRGRDWHSAPGLGAYVSIVLRPRLASGHLPRFTLAAAVAACDAAREQVGASVVVKWPNDLIAGERKLGGILAETRTQGATVADLVLGVGLNVGHAEHDFPPLLRRRATSLRLLAAGQTVERETWIVSYLKHLVGHVRGLEAGEWANIARRWESLAPACRGRRVAVLSGEGAETMPRLGHTHGIDDQGALRVRLDAGDVISVRLDDTLRPAG